MAREEQEWDEARREIDGGKGSARFSSQLSPQTEFDLVKLTVYASSAET